MRLFRRVLSSVATAGPPIGDFLEDALRRLAFCFDIGDGGL
jgi:hypothetical protein